MSLGWWQENFAYFYSMTQKLVLFACLLFAATAGYSQKGRFFDGYVVTAKGDSLNGIVALDSENKWVAFKEGKGGDRTVYYPNDLKAFGIADVRYICETVEVTRNRFPELVHTFLQVMVQGPVELVQYSGETLLGAEEVNHYFIRSNGSLLYRVPEKDKAFAKQMSSYFEEYSEISEQIRAGELVYADMPRIVILFNAWLESQE
jgi:hypothetical protein